MKKVIFLSFIFSLIACLQFFNQAVFAITIPTPLTPGENFQTTDTSPKLTWEYLDTCSSNESCFKVEVDNSSDFSSLDKSTYTNNLFYSPQLSLGIWYWRVKGKDISNTWSEYSTVRSFEIIAQSSATSTPTASPDQSTQNTDITNKTTPIFEISQIPPDIKSSEEFLVKVKTTSLDQNSTYYLKGAFLKIGSTNYFGKTQVLGNWVKNSENFAKQFLITTNEDGTFKGDLKIIVDTEDSGYLGSGNYFFKVGRYNSSGSGPTWSNQVSINITDNQPEKTGTPSPAKNPTSSPKQTVPTEIPKGSFTSISKNKIKVGPKIKTASIAGVSTNSAQIPIPSPIVQNQIGEIPKFMGFKYNTLLMAGGILFLLIGLSSLFKLIRK